jgi:outer membrane receptor protein involved in Fe transport
MHIKNTKRHFIAVIPLLLPLCFTQGQASIEPNQNVEATQTQTQSVGRIVGQIFDADSGSTISGATLVIDGSQTIAITDLEGKFQFDKIPEGTCTLTVSKSGYRTARISDFVVSVAALNKLDLPLQIIPVSVADEVVDMGIYEVSAESLSGTNIALQSLRLQSAASIDALSASEMSRLGAGDVAEALSKVTGVSVSDGKYAVIRGLNDRYATAELNGITMPPPDPDRQAVQMDLFPSELVESVQTSKTFTPDQTGESTGGSINIKTRSFPEEMMLSAKVSVGYDSQATGNDKFLSNHRGRYDYMARGNNHRPFPSTKGMAATPYNEAPGPNTGFAFNYGDTFKLDTEGNLRLGALLAGTWDLSYNYTETDWNRYDNDDGGANGSDPMSADSRRTWGKQFQGTEDAAFSLLSGVGLKFGGNHQVIANALHTQFGTSEATRSEYDNRYITGSGELKVVQELFYRERKLTNYQIMGQHLLPGNLQWNWRASHAINDQREPSTLSLPATDKIGTAIYAYYINNGLPIPDALLNNRYSIPGDGNGGPPTEFNRHTHQTNALYNTDLDIPFRLWTQRDTVVKTGLYYEKSERSFDQHIAHFGKNPRNISAASTVPSLEDVNNFFRGKPIVTAEADGERQIRAGYLMLDLPLMDSLRVITGARYEETCLFYSGYGRLTQVVYDIAPIAPRPIDESDWLPSVNLIWEIKKDMNLRLAWSQTLARPSFRELSPFPLLNLVDQEIEQGNQDLELSSIDNYDLRWEYFRENGQMLAVSLFYKTLSNPIERAIIGDFGAYNPQDTLPISSYENNVNDAEIYGVEIEARQSLAVFAEALSNFSVGGNFTWLESEVKRNPRDYNLRKYMGISEERPLQGQPAWIVNCDVGYNNTQSRTEVNLIWSAIGEQLDTIGGEFNADRYADTYWQIDLNFSQGLFKNLKLKFSVKNITNNRKEIVYKGLNADGLVYSTYRPGTDYSLSLNYSF